MRPIDALEGNAIPVLFIHGEEDDFILPQNSKDLYEKTSGIKELRLMRCAKHAESALVDPGTYSVCLTDFFGMLGPE